MLNQIALEHIIFTMYLRLMTHLTVKTYFILVTNSFFIIEVVSDSESAFRVL